MQGAVAVGSSSGLNAASVASSYRLPEGVTQTPSLSYWGPKSKGLHGKSHFRERRWSEKPIFGRASGNVRLISVKADATTNGSSKANAPLQPESPSGQFLVELLHTHPHLFSAAAEQQLEKLAEDRDATSGRAQSNAEKSELVLYKRIAEVRAQERRRALEDIMYALVSQRFVEAGISMVPKISSVPGSQKVDHWPAQEKELEDVHSHEAFEMIREHLALVLGGRASDSLDQNIMVQISKLRMGRVYAASVVYGYFLRRVDQRFQLEKTIKILPQQLFDTEREGLLEPMDDQSDQQSGLVADAVAAVLALVPAGGLVQYSNSSRAGQPGIKASRLRAYLMSFDSDTLRRYATIRSKESASVIERHTEALFGKPEIQITPDGAMAVVKDELIMLSFSGLKRLVLEAVAFGTFLWDVETYVDSHYNVMAH